MSPDRRRHRGPHPEDARLFAPERLPALRRAVAELSWLSGRGYAMVGATKLVGDRHQLTERQRRLVVRAACPEPAARARRAREVHACTGRLQIDAYNQLISMEAALAGGLVFRGRDGALRDLASQHGTFRTVEETRPALLALGRTAAHLGPSELRWLIDMPVSNSGRLRALVEEVGRELGQKWSAACVRDPDPLLAACGEIVATSDSVILDRAPRVLPLARLAIAEHAPSAWLLDFGAPLAPGLGP